VIVSPFKALLYKACKARRRSVRMINRRKCGKAAQNKDHKRCCGSHGHDLGSATPLTLQHSYNLTIGLRRSV